ncbi:hypothetical protein M427DRAFT_497917 [Gonapodya prolifera JEL478]|uniref:Uncharacterized protein n=1 Tax=Gonapodya prolifera (strain JEL478) TaxID=1344416 RepID=A0A139AE13_GONPJ|nr:hypothetical protein M427DRAFT_497917 [Gonapodya prolifera JEL478]|eukprot:KXS15000.1 hypothetical protein M427DRAFT_497917 [Gonapodya prolifera JEL478]
MPRLSSTKDDQTVLPPLLSGATLTLPVKVASGLLSLRSFLLAWAPLGSRSVEVAPRTVDDSPFGSTKPDTLIDIHARYGHQSKGESSLETNESLIFSIFTIAYDKGACEESVAREDNIRVPMRRVPWTGDTRNTQEHRNVSKCRKNVIFRKSVAMTASSVKEITDPDQSHPTRSRPSPTAPAPPRAHFGFMKGLTLILVFTTLFAIVSLAIAAPLGNRSVNVAARSVEGDLSDSTAVGAAELHSVVGLHARGYVKGRPGLPQEGYGGSGGSHN